MPFALTGEFHVKDTDDEVRETFTKPTGALGTVWDMTNIHLTVHQD